MAYSHNHDHGSMERYLVILPPAIGDAVCAIPAVAMLRARHPESSLHLCCSSTTHPLFSDWSLCDGAVTYQDVPILSEGRWDWLIDLASIPATFAMHTVISSQNRTYHSTTTPNEYYTNGQMVSQRSLSKEYRSFSEEPNQPAWLLEGALVATILSEDLTVWHDEGFEPCLEFKTPHTTYLKLAGLEMEQDIVIAPCGNKGPRRWAEACWVELVRMIKSTGTAITVVLGPEEMRDYPDLVRQEGIRVLYDIDTRTLAAIFAEAALVIANDCGPAHIAAASGAKTLAIYGPTNPLCWFAYSGEHRQYIQNGPPANPLGILNDISSWTRWPSAMDVFQRALKMTTTRKTFT